jgi:transglutaminase-like putative cysteine protease
VLIRAGFNIAFECKVATPLLLMLHLHSERRVDLREPEKFTLYPEIPHRSYVDRYGNTCTRLVAPAGKLSIWNRFMVADSGLPEPVPDRARQVPVDELPDGVLVFLLGSRYCDTQKFSEIAWSLFGGFQPGWPCVRAILQYTHDRITFGYQHARSNRTAWDAHEERVGVCRDYAHLAITLCRCMNIPARYCTGYLGDIGVPLDPNPMDFSAWFDVYLEGGWYAVDARHNHPRIGRILMARGRDATDAAISTAFGIAELVEFTVFTNEVAMA